MTHNYTSQGEGKSLIEGEATACGGLVQLKLLRRATGGSMDVVAKMGELFIFSFYVNLRNHISY